MLDLCQCIASVEDHHNEALFASKKNVLIFNSFEAIVRSLPRFSFTGESPVVISSSLLISPHLLDDENVGELNFKIEVHADGHISS